jgi:hypothetical protein
MVMTVWRSSFVGVASGAFATGVRFVRGRHRVFSVAEASDRRAALDLAWDSAFPGGTPTAGSLRADFPERWARFHTRGLDDEGTDQEALATLRLLLGDLRADRSHVQLIIEEYGAGDMFGGWSKTLPIALFPWRRVRRDGWWLYFWASDPIVDQELLDPVLESAVTQESRSLIVDHRAGWVFCPYFAGVDIVFRTAAERSAFAHRHGAVLAPTTNER